MTNRDAIPSHQPTRGRADLPPEGLDWDKQGGLLPAVVQDADTRRVLMLGYMDRDALRATLDTGRVTFYSRSKGRLWTKGERSGHFLELVDVAADCDADALLVRARPRGPTCHLARPSCFDGDASGDSFRRVVDPEPGTRAGTAAGSADAAPNRDVAEGRRSSNAALKGRPEGTLTARAAPSRFPPSATGDAGGAGTPDNGADASVFAFLAELDALIARRDRERPPGSYTTRLFEDGVRRIAQKVGEEGVETALAGVVQDEDALLGESADLLYHLAVLLRARGLSLAGAVRLLAQRHGK